MTVDAAKANVARTAHLTAWVRALGRLTSGEAANGDYLAERVLLPYQRFLTRTPKLARWLLERGLPGAFGYFNARTQYFDQVLMQEARTGLEQVVILGAGFDSRSLRFSDALRAVRVFEVDMPEVLAIRTARLFEERTPPSSNAVPIDFEHDDLGTALRERGYASGAPTLFLWEGVTYVTRAFVDGDHRSYGARRLADGWRRLGNVNRFGVDDIAAFVRPLGLSVRSDIDADELERRHLTALPGPPLKPWGCMHIAHATRS